MTKTIISIISSVSLLSVGSSAMALTPIWRGNTQQGEQEYRIRQLEERQEALEHQMWMNRPIRQQDLCVGPGC